MKAGRNERAHEGKIVQDPRKELANDPIHREARVDRFQNIHRTFRDFEVALPSSSEIVTAAPSSVLRGKALTNSVSSPDSSESGGVGRPFKLMYLSFLAKGLPGLHDRAEGVLGGLDDADDEGLESLE